MEIGGVQDPPEEEARQWQWGNVTDDVWEDIDRDSILQIYLHLGLYDISYTLKAVSSYHTYIHHYPLHAHTLCPLLKSSLLLLD